MPISISATTYRRTYDVSECQKYTFRSVEIVIFYAKESPRAIEARRTGRPTVASLFDAHCLTLRGARSRDSLALADASEILNMIIRRKSTGGEPPRLEDGRLGGVLRGLDAFARPTRELKGLVEPTAWGGMFTLLVGLILSTLFILQLASLVSPNFVTEIDVDHQARNA